MKKFYYPITMCLSLFTVFTACQTSAPITTVTPNKPAVPTTPANQTATNTTSSSSPIQLNPTSPLPVNSPITTGGAVCAPLIGINALDTQGQSLNSSDSLTIKGYLTLTSSLSCSDNVSSVQYMYRRTDPVGTFSPFGALQNKNDGYRQEVNTLTDLTDGLYEIVSKVILNDSSVHYSSALTIKIENQTATVGKGGGGGGGGGSTSPSASASSSPSATTSPSSSPSASATATPEPTPIPGNVSFNVNPTINVPAGTQKWSLNLGQEMSSTPLVDVNGNSFFAADNEFYSYSASGAKLDSVDLGYAITAPSARYKDPITGDDFIYVGISNIPSSPHAKLLKIDITDPANLIKTEIDLSNADGFDYNAPAIGCDGTVYIQSTSRRLFKVTSADQATELIPAITLPGDFPVGATSDARYASPVIDDANHRVFTGSQHGIQIVNNVNTGSPVLTSFVPTTACDSSGTCSNAATSLDQAINSPLAIDSVGHAYAISETGTLYKFNPGSAGSSGNLSPEWSVFVGEGDSNPVIGSDGTVYIASENGVLNALNPVNGSTLFSIGLGNVVEFSAPAIGAGPDGDVIYVGTEAGTLFSFNGFNKPGGATGGISWESVNPSNPAHRGTNSGVENYRKNLGAPIRSSITIAEDGTVYAGTLDGRLYTIFGETTGLAGQWPKAQGDLNGLGRVGSCS